MISQRPAIAYGGTLDEGIHALATLPEALARAARQDGVKGITYLQPDGSELTQSYRDLCEEAESILAGLRALGLQAGDKVILQVEENHLYLPTFWACVLGGMVAVPISIAPSYEQPGVITARLQNAWELCERPIVVASTRVASALYALAPALGMEAVRMRPSIRCVLSFPRQGSEGGIPVSRTTYLCFFLRRAVQVFPKG